MVEVQTGGRVIMLKSGELVFGFTYEEFLTQAEKIFFHAMKQGYAFDAKPSKHLKLDGWKEISPVEVGKWIVTDEWGPRGGRTIIRFDGFEVWVMGYFGHYDDEAIPTLKAALADRYTAGEFCGGRGPKSFGARGAFYYENKWHGDFEDFSCRDAVLTSKSQDGAGNVIASVGSHRCWGGMII